MRILVDSQQAVLFDVTRKAHVMVEVGMKIAGYTVIEIDDDAVTLVASGKQLVLAAPAPIAKEEPAKPNVASPKPPEREPLDEGDVPSVGPVDPYADDLGKDTPTANTTPVDPYAEDPGTDTVAIVTPARPAPATSPAAAHHAAVRTSRGAGAIRCSHRDSRDRPRSGSRDERFIGARHRPRDADHRRARHSHAGPARETSAAGRTGCRIDARSRAAAGRGCRGAR